MRTLISNAIIVNEGKEFCGSIVINDDRIEDILHGNKLPDICCDRTVDATGLYLIPGIIDDHVHFREPGLTEKATICTESHAAAAGGVTSFMEMPNTKPQTTTLEALNEKFCIAEKDSIINYSFYFGATNDNRELFEKLNPNEICGIKLFMGSSTGNMLVDKTDELEKIFSTATIPVAVHCEDSRIIAQNSKRVTEEKGENPGVEYHPVIRSREACYESTKLAVELAQKHNTKLHIMHISTAEEVALLENTKNNLITAEATPAHLFYSEEDYKTLGTGIKCNPAIKTSDDREALRQAVKKGVIEIIGTDHAPHLLKDKEGGALKAASGIPTIQFSLLAMLQLCDEEIFDIGELVERMCHAPAKIFDIAERGYIKNGYKADFVLLQANTPHTITTDEIVSKCGWSPFEGKIFNWQVKQTWVNGHCVYDNGIFHDETRGEKLTFNR